MTMRAPLIGIDFGHASVKVASVARGKKPFVVGCGTVPVDPALLTKDGFKEPKAVAQAVLQALHLAVPKHLSKGQAVISLSESLLFRRIIDLPGTASLAVETVKLQAAEFLPLPLDEMEFDYIPLPHAEGAATRQVIAVACSSKIINEYVQVVKLAGLELIAIDSKPSCVARALSLPATQPVLLVDIGSEQVTLSIVQNGTVFVAALINVGANALYDPSTSQLLKEEEVMVAAKHIASLVGEEAGHVVKFFTSRESTSSVERAVISGGGAEQKVLLQALAAELPVKVLDVALLMPLPPQWDRRYVGAIGASLYV